MDVLFEDNHLLGVFKQPGISVQGDSSGGASLLANARAWLKAKYSKPGNVYLGLLHRLDKPVSGVLVFAKTSKAASRMSALFRNREVSKTYLAVIEGIPGNGRGQLNHFLSRDDPRGITQVHDEAGPGRKAASLDFAVIRSRGDSSVVEVNLGTGRKHQIRAQFSHLGMPILGDSKYGSKLPWMGRGIALCATSLEFFHPVTGQTLRLSLPGELCPLRGWL